MRRAALAIALLATSFAASDRATARPLSFHATLTIELGAPPFATFATTGSGVAATSGSGPPNFTIPASVLSVSGTHALSGIYPQYLAFTAKNGAGVFSVPLTFFPVRGQMPLHGKLKHGAAFVGSGSGQQFAAVVTATPIGNGGKATAMFVVCNGTNFCSTHNATLSGGFFDATNDQRTTSGVGNIQLVVPFTFHSVAPLQTTPGNATLSITFTPEPSLGLAELASTAALILVGFIKRARNGRWAETSTQG